MTHYVPPRPPDPQRRSVMLLASRLTRRDRIVLRALWDHHVLTTGQIAQLTYPNRDRARRGMLRLAGLGAVERFRPLLPPGKGTAPLHFTIGQPGAHLIAAEHDVPFSELGYRRDRVIGWALSPKLPHLLGVNGIFTALAAAARAHPAAELAEWWPEQRCAQTWAPYIRPDGFGRWREGGDRGTEVDFFLEYDTGTERPLSRVAAKLTGYARLAAADGYATPVLVWTSSPRRETNLHRQLGIPPVPVFTATDAAVHDPQLGPAGPVWLPVGQQPGTPRLRLIALAHHTRTAKPRDDGGNDGD